MARRRLTAAEASELFKRQLAQAREKRRQVKAAREGGTATARPKPTAAAPIVPGMTRKQHYRKRTCIRCGDSYQAARDHARFCSAVCRMLYYRQHH